MNDIEFMQIFNASDYLMEKFDSERFLNSLIFYDKVKKFAARCILHDQVELFWRLNNLIELDNMRVSYHF